MKRSMKWLFFVLVICSTSVYAQDDEDESLELDSISVTGARITLGGVKDINHFRSVVFEENDIPRPDSLSVEGLLSEHDLQLRMGVGCKKLMCLTGEYVQQGLPNRPEDVAFAGVGFSSMLTTWKREPLNLVAVVDKSGSMDGEPLDLVRAALQQIAQQMHGTDQLAIVLYGDSTHVHLPPTVVQGQRNNVSAAIRAIESAGSTDMESGLKLGFQLARESAKAFPGNTRVMLFTDEQPNVGATDPDTFMGMAQAASLDDVGMTTIGVGVQYDGLLAKQIGSVRGGNVFFLADRNSVKKLFKRELDSMVSEVAHDVLLQFIPADGFKISGVFGVPNSMLENAPDGAIQMRVPTTFFSTKAGGIFLAMARNLSNRDLPTPKLRLNEAMLEVKVSYQSALDDTLDSDALKITHQKENASRGLRTAYALVDEYLVLRDASLIYHREGKPKLAYQMLNDLGLRLQSSLDSKSAVLDSLRNEVKLVNKMVQKTALMSGYTGEYDAELRSRILDGAWKVKSFAGAAGAALQDATLVVDESSCDFDIASAVGRAVPKVLECRFDGSKLTIEPLQLQFDRIERKDQIIWLKSDNAAIEIEPAPSDFE